MIADYVFLIREIFAQMTTKQRMILRGSLILLAFAFDSGVIQTHADGGGRKVAAGIVAIVAMIPGGDKTPENVKQLADEVRP